MSGGGDGVKGEVVGIVILANCEHHFIRVNENLVQHPNDNVSIRHRQSISFGINKTCF